MSGMTPGSGLVQEPGLVGGGAALRAPGQDDWGAVSERAVDGEAVTPDPADVGGTPVGVFLLHVEDPAGGGRHAEEVAGGRVDDALGLPGRAAGVEDVKRV